MSKDNPNFPSVDMNKLLKKSDNRFLISVAAAKRARQIKEGDRPTIDHVPDEPMNHVNLALNEIIEDKVTFEIKTDKIDENELLDKLENHMDAEIAEEKKNEESEKKEKGKKSKSLAA